MKISVNGAAAMIGRKLVRASCGHGIRVHIEHELSNRPPERT
ncbi:hypothetical protein FHT78_002842 [Rhizobium sp. BK196]|jgi:hypothetical protein|nr:hypothetical protein [Rhizobium sp. BK196]MBB3460111.1 hypothetical protein [Rhizobium sp. BK377]